MSNLKFDKEDFENLKQCPWCSSADFEKWGNNVGDFSAARCNACGLVFINNRLNKQGLVKYYKDYLNQEHLSSDLLIEQRKKMYQLEFDLVRQYSKPGRVLDVGCSGGFFLDFFAKDGYECHGVEFGEAAAQTAQKKYPVSWGEFDQLNLDQKFDLIVFRGVIEHVPHPKSYLQEAIRLLNDGGYIYITSTPNADSFCCNLFKEQWTQYEPEEHMMFFKVKHFDDYFHENGFTKMVEHYFYEETPYANVEEDILQVAEAIKLKRENKDIPFKSCAFWGNLLSLIYQKKG